MGRYWPTLVCGVGLFAGPGSALPPRPLQPLIDAAPPGSVLVPPPGRYLGPAVVDKPLTLDGAGEVTLDGQGQGTVLTVRAPGVTVRRMHLTGSGFRHDTLDAAVSIEGEGDRFESNTLDGVLFGVVLQGANRTRVCGNSIRSRPDQPGIRGDAVRVWNGAHNLIAGNDVIGSRDVTVSNSHDNALVGNRIRDGRFGTQLVFAPRTRLEGNWLDGNLTGVVVLYSDDVVIRGNRIQNSPGVTGVGLAFKESSQAVVEDNAVIHCAVGAKANSPTHPLNVLYFRRNLFAHNVAAMDFYGENGGHVIHGNRFEHNLMQVTVSAPMSARGNDWLGNTWDDYEGFDQNGDGVGDVPHSIWWFADRIFFEEPRATFFRKAPVFELLDFLERLAPFASPQLILEDPRPLVGASASLAIATRAWPAFAPFCPPEELP